jgi:hypothetical protein
MDGRVSPEVRAMALAGVGELAFDQGDLDRAQEACQEGLELLEHEEGREAREAKLTSSYGWGLWHGLGKSTSGQSSCSKKAWL